jgi:hypothetical protein
VYWANCPGETAGRYNGVTARLERIEGERTRETRAKKKTTRSKFDRYTRFRNENGYSRI